MPGGVICFIAVKIFSALLFGFWDNCVRLWEVAGLLLWTLFAVIVIMVRLKREKKQDILI